eukprot:3792494-Pyramimonas_sp.AAC.1
MSWVHAREAGFPVVIPCTSVQTAVLEHTLPYELKHAGLFYDIDSLLLQVQARAPAIILTSGGYVVPNN